MSARPGAEFFARDAQAAIEPLPHVTELSARAEELMQAAGSDAELTVHERTHISRLSPT